jgi:phosphomannomutase/phosphoglucomutase
MRGVVEAGAYVIDIGLWGAEEVYFATSHYRVGGGVMITASHNPKGYNGKKIVRLESRPISGDTSLESIRKRVDRGAQRSVAVANGNVHQVINKSAYIDRVLTYVDVSSLKPLKILAYPGNGAVGPVLQALAA